MITMSEGLDEIDRYPRRGHQIGGVEHAGAKPVPARNDVRLTVEVLKVVGKCSIAREAAVDIADSAYGDVVNELRDVGADQRVVNEKEAILLRIAPLFECCVLLPSFTARR
jgi:hypothetical protein